MNLALKYLEKNISVFPINNKTKRPFVEWKEFQDHLADEKTIRGWWANFPKAMIGLATGKLSGITIIDFDQKNGGLETLKTLNLPPTLTVQTPGGGFHYYYKYNPILPQTQNILPGVDIRNDGGFAVAAGSVREDGVYQPVLWGIETFEHSQMAEFPNECFAQFNYKKDKTNGEWKKYLSGVGVGNRNGSAASVVGALLNRFPPEEWAIAWELITGWNMKNKPPLDERELITVFKSIAKYASKSWEQKSNFFKE